MSPVYCRSELIDLVCKRRRRLAYGFVAHSLPFVIGHDRRRAKKFVDELREADVTRYDHINVGVLYQNSIARDCGQSGATSRLRVRRAIVRRP